MDGHVILSQTVIHEAPELLVDHALLFKRHPEAPYQATEHLAASGLWVEHPPDGERAHCAGHTDRTEVLVDMYLGEHSGVGVGAIARLFRGWPGRDAGFELVHHAVS